MNKKGRENFQKNGILQMKNIFLLFFEENDKDKFYLNYLEQCYFIFLISYFTLSFLLHFYIQVLFFKKGFVNSYDIFGILIVIVIN